MKVGLITIYHVPNYGSVLQTYATQELLRNLGHDVKVIQYNYFNDRYYKEMGRRPSFRERFYSLKTLLMPKCKAAVLKRFRKQFLDFTSPFDNQTALEKYDWSGYDAFVVGSDQVWNTKYLLGDPCFLLQFAPSDKRRFSLSSSFATKTIANKYTPLFKNELNKFKALSVRENNGIAIIHNQLKIDKPVKVTLDPTLLLSKEQWIEKFPFGTKRKKPYILYYMWAYAFEPRPYIYEVVKHFSNKMKCEVVALEGIRDSKDCKDIDFIDADNSTIPEFLSLFANASLVVTSSFHGTAFALNFGVPLVSVVPDNVGDDRQTSLLKACGAENCIAKIDSEIETIQPQYDITVVKDKLENLRQDSINWIKSNII